MSPVPQDIKPCDNVPWQNGKVRRLHCLRLISALFPPLLELFVPCSFPAQSLHKQLGCIDNCIQVVCVFVWMSGVPCSPPALFSEIKLEAAAFFLFLFFWPRFLFAESHTPNFSAVQPTGKRAYLPLLSRGQWRGVTLSPPPDPKASSGFLSSIHCHCLLIGWLFGQPGVTGPKCDSTFLPLEPV